MSVSRNMQITGHARVIVEAGKFNIWVIIDNLNLFTYSKSLIYCRYRFCIVISHPKTRFQSCGIEK